ncbi:CidA/LrgA family protein [Salidesulfovibrio onnuriiensis]|uniref:CidA/LrgA family protein n=1 Tax=Salidesulfovibrio onnuriiensis TaxID=2583823 RepID=UPI0011C79CB9|nr:CidA/LrgA family protein [Salidesulfovibrio onnuriiensis]
MNTRTMTIPVRRRIRRSRPAQIGLLFLLWLGCECGVRVLGLPIPGGILGMIAAYVLLACNRVSLSSLRRGAEWYLGEMLLFFIPAVPAIIEHRELLGMLGLKLVAVILAGTVAVMAVTALTVDLFYRWSVRHEPTDSPLE